MEPDSIIFDLGAAEGIFALNVIEKAKKIYIFESEKEWLLPLQKTFEPWKDKITIINKYASENDSESTIKLDAIAKDIEPNQNIFLKLDVEGAEKQVLIGAKQLLNSDNQHVKAAICTYHYPQDYNNLTDLMVNDFNYNISTSKGYMCCFYGGVPDSEYFRRTMIYCYKKHKTAI